MEPRAASIRILSGLSYLPPVAIALLLTPGYRSVRHVRLHAMRSLALMILFIGGAVLISKVGSFLGSLPGIGFWILSVSGLSISFWMLLMLGCSVHGGIAAYQGKSTRLPLLERALRQLDRSFVQRATLPVDPPKRHRKQSHRD